MDFDLIVIGAGPGGSACAKEAHRLGLKVALIEEKHLGGTCLNTGCMPTKALFEAVKVKKSFEDAFLHANKVVFDLKNLTEAIRQFGFKIFDNKVLKIENNFVYLNDKSKLKFSYLVLATGSRPIILNVEDKSKVITNENFLQLKTLPKNLAIIGGGYIGCEFANIFSKLGSNVTIFEKASFILSTEDKECIKEISSSLKKQNVKIFLETEFEDSGFDNILFSVGRIPNSELLHNIVNSKGKLDVNNNLRTKINNVFAVGDVIDKPYRLAHVAEYEGKIAARNISIDFNKTNQNYFEVDYSCIPTRVFTDPLITCIGLKDFELPSDCNYVVGRAWFKANGMPYCKGDLRGFVKVIINPITKQFYGACSVGDVDLHEIGVAIQNKIKADDFIKLIHFHPGYQEIVKEAVENALFHAIK